MKVRIYGKSFTFIIVSVVTAFAVQANRPKLMVGIVVDGLRQEALDILRPYLGQDGFNRFLNSGVVFDNIDYGTNVDAPTATAILMTGAAPSANGVSKEYIYDASARRIHHVFEDPTYVGLYTTEKLSPKAMNVSTISDEMRIAGAGVTYVYAIAPNSAQALVMGGHAGNSAIWFDEKTGQWATSKYYKEVPNIAGNINRTNLLKNKIETSQWTPSSKTTDAVQLPDHLKRYPFTYSFPSKDTDRFARFAASPLMNSEVSRMAEEYITLLNLGKHDGTDVLNIAFNLQPYQWSRTAENRYELYDSYLRLDQSLAELFSTIDSTVGKDNVIIYLAATPPRDQRHRYDDKWNIPTGQFSSRKAVSLLNLYLIAKYGNGEWINAYHDGGFYINSELVKRQSQDINTIRREAADFLIRMAGVGHAYTIDDVINAEAKVPNSAGRSRNTVIAHVGDIMIELIPGWTLIDDFNLQGAKSSNIFSPAPTTATFMISAPELSAKHINTQVDARAIAPALSGLMHIRSPNGAGTPAVSFK